MGSHCPGDVCPLGWSPADHSSQLVLGLGDWEVGRLFMVLGEVSSSSPLGLSARWKCPTSTELVSDTCFQGEPTCPCTGIVQPVARAQPGPGRHLISVNAPARPVFERLMAKCRPDQPCGILHAPPKGRTKLMGRSRLTLEGQQACHVPGGKSHLEGVGLLHTCLEMPGKTKGNGQRDFSIHLEWYRTRWSGNI